MAAQWRNWAGDQACTPSAFEHPSSVDEVAQAVVRSEQVRVAGAGHSFTDAVLTDGTLLSLDRMNRVLDVDRASGLVRVEAGITLGALSDELWKHGLAFENLGDIDVQSIAGATATGTHGTGARLRNLSAALHSIELVLADGSTIEVSEESDPDAWRAARVSVGALGVVTAVTLQAVPAFTLEGVDRGRPLDEVLDTIDELADGSEHFEFFTFPHSPLALTRTNRRVPGPPRPRRPRAAWLEDEVLKNGFFGVMCRAGRARPALIPRINRVVSRLGGMESRLVDRSYRIFATPRSVRFTEMEYAIPREHAVDALRAVRALVEDGGLAVSFPFEMRFVAPDDAFLSPAGGRETCYIASHMFEGMEYEPFMRGVEEIMDGFGGRPHWGKRHFQTAETLRPRYPEWDRFAAVRDRLDPRGRFANDYVRRVLGPPVSARTPA
jgi:L-gulonolactone oxidase